MRPPFNDPVGGGTVGTHASPLRRTTQSAYESAPPISHTPPATSRVLRRSLEGGASSPRARETTGADASLAINLRAEHPRPPVIHCIQRALADVGGRILQLFKRNGRVWARPPHERCRSGRAQRVRRAVRAVCADRDRAGSPVRGRQLVLAATDGGTMVRCGPT